MVQLCQIVRDGHQLFQISGFQFLSHGRQFARVRGKGRCGCGCLLRSPIKTLCGGNDDQHIKPPEPELDPNLGLGAVIIHPYAKFREKRHQIVRCAFHPVSATGSAHRADVFAQF